MTFFAEIEKGVKKLASLFHDNPHSFLGLQEEGNRKKIHLWIPGEKQAWIEVKGKQEALSLVHKAGLFSYELKEDLGAFHYQIIYPNGLKTFDPYNFPPFFEEREQKLFLEESHPFLYEKMGASILEKNGIEGTLFSVWAPRALGVSVVGDFNNYNSRLHPMRRLSPSGIFELFIPNVGEGALYQFEIHSCKGVTVRKNDPFAFFQKKRPLLTPVVYKHQFLWKDQLWMQRRKQKKYQKEPINIYEVHLGSWAQQEGFLNYRDLAKKLSEYVKEMHFNYVELLPIMEHPLDESWGYQIVGFFAPTSRFGSPEDFQYFVNYLHERDIGVILDWSPAHFPSDSFALANFDGSPLFEYEDIQKRKQPKWDTLVFDYQKKQVQNFLISSVLFWCEKMHIDGIRVDAVSSMLFLDFYKKPGEWSPNIHGEKYNLEAKAFLQKLNKIVKEKMPDVLMIAEEGTSFCGVTTPLEEGGLGFALKWNLGWTFDTLLYFSKPLQKRKNFQEKLLFKMVYDYNEKFLSVLSHDEVALGCKSLWDKMPGEEIEKVANILLLYSYFICSTGKKLSFMGIEFAYRKEWDACQGLLWDLLEKEPHKRVQETCKALNSFYQKNSALWEKDFEREGFEWVFQGKEPEEVIAYIRRSTSQELFIIHHFSDLSLPSLFFPISKKVELLARVSAKGYEKRGDVVAKMGYNQQRIKGLEIAISPLSTLIFEVFP